MNFVIYHQQTMLLNNNLQSIKTMSHQENNKKQEVEKLYASVNFDFDKFDSIEFLIATDKLNKKGIIGPFDYEYESETDVLKAVTCANITTPQGKDYTIKYDGELKIT